MKGINMEGLSLKESAIKYAKNGFYVAPLWPRSKEPMLGFKYDKPSFDPYVVNYWWERCENANIALPTGVNYNNLIVIDLDVLPNTNGCETLQILLNKNNIVLPETAVSQSGSGGFHIFYRNTLKYKIQSKKNAFCGIDILAEGAHIVAPPSIHQTGKMYTWYRGDFSKIADANQAVYKLLMINGKL
jgi:hypothetical protein